MEKDVKSEKRHVCQACGSSFNRPYRLTQHLLLHQNIKIFQCGEEGCDKSYTSKSHLDRHLYSVHIKPNFDVIHRCPHCMKTFANRQNLKRHIKIKHVKKVMFTCDVCKADFKKKHLLSSHMYQHTLVKAFSCELCSKEFISLLDRKKHMKYHKIHNCEQCDMAFNQWSKYQKHKKLEHSIKEYNCNECGRKFKQRHHMVHHTKTHMITKPKTKVFPCWYEDCKRVYSRHSNLKQHVETKHLKLTHTCEICEAQLSSKAVLKSHLKTHCKSDVNRRYPKTKESGRKERKDKGASKFSTALKLAGFLLDPESEEKKIEVNKQSKKNGNALQQVEIKYGAGETPNIEKSKNEEKSEPYKEEFQTVHKTLVISPEPIHEMDTTEIKTKVKIDEKCKDKTMSTPESPQDLSTKVVENSTVVPCIKLCS